MIVSGDIIPINFRLFCKIQHHKFPNKFVANNSVFDCFFFFDKTLGIYYTYGINLRYIRLRSEPALKIVEGTGFLLIIDYFSESFEPSFTKLKQCFSVLIRV